MSENIPHRKEPRKKPDYKIRPGFSDEELQEFMAYCSKHDLPPGRFTRRALLNAIGRPLTDIVSQP